MPEGGLDLSRPPVRPWRVGAHKQLVEMLHGANLYSMGAGGFGQVPALPNMIRLRQPANPNSHNAAQASQLYVTRPLPTRQAIRQRFGPI